MRGLGIGDVVQHGTRGDEIEAAGLESGRRRCRPCAARGWAPHVDQRQVEIDRDHLAGWADAPGEPARDRAVAAADLDRPGARRDAELVQVPAVHGSSSRDISASRARSPVR